MKKLQKLELDNFREFQLKKTNHIFGGVGTCFGTCCGEKTGCEDWEDDPEDTTSIIA